MITNVAKKNEATVLECLSKSSKFMNVEQVELVINTTIARINS